MLQEVEVQSIVRLGEVDEGRSRSFARGPAEAEGRGQDGCLKLGLLPSADEQRGVLVKPHSQLLGSDLGPGSVNQGQHCDGPGL